MTVLDIIDAKLATRKAYDAAKRTMDLLSAITDDETSIPFRIEEILDSAKETLVLATEADALAFARLADAYARAHEAQADLSAFLDGRAPQVGEG
jgi:hypothetical protein